MSLGTVVDAEAASVLGRKSCPGTGPNADWGFTAEAVRENPPSKQEGENSREIMKERQMDSTWNIQQNILMEKLH